MTPFILFLPNLVAILYKKKFMQIYRTTLKFYTHLIHLLNRPPALDFLYGILMNDYYFIISSNDFLHGK